MSFFDRMFHDCEYIPGDVVSVKGYRHVYLYNPQGPDVSYWMVAVNDKEYRKKYKPETENVLILKCSCGNEIISDTQKIPGEFFK